VLRCIQMIQSQPNHLARPTGPRSARPEDHPCAGHPRKPARRCGGSSMPTELVRGLKAHGPSPATMIE
jgi:hypothetical protein